VSLGRATTAVVLAACRLFVACGALTTARPASAAADRLTLADAVTAALASGYQARIARLETDRADSVVGETRAAYLPRVSVTANSGYSNRFDDKLRAVDRRGVERTYGLASLGASEGWVNVYVDQLLFDLGQLRLLEREQLAAEAARLAEAVERDEVAYRVTRSYANLIRLDESVAAAGETLAAAERLDVHARLLFTGGRLVATDREQVELYLEETRLDIRARQDEAFETRIALAHAIGATDAAMIPAPALAPESLPRPGRGGLAVPGETAIGAAPDLQLLALRRRIEGATVASARAGHLPRFRLRGGYSHYGIKRFDNFPDETFVWVGMDLPIFDGFSVKNAVDGAQTALEVAELRYRAALQEKRGALGELVRRLAAAERRHALAARQAANAREEARLAELRVRAERVSIVEALDTRQRAGAQQERAIASRFEWIDLWASLHRATGQLAGIIVADGHTPAPAGD
jgi:outer membrane protein